MLKHVPLVGLGPFTHNAVRFGLFGGPSIEWLVQSTIREDLGLEIRSKGKCFQVQPVTC